jgi:hypothetical protein
MTQAQQVFRHGDTKLTGITQFKNTHEGGTALICCSGTTFAKYDDKWAPRSWKRFAINEAIGKLHDTADFWVLSDNQIVFEYAGKCSPKVKILCMHEATKIIKKHCRSHEIHTVESMNKIRPYDNGHEFFSRGTVMIGAIEMARYMGFKRFFCFGLDCYRLLDQYYYDGRRPIPLSEKQFDPRRRAFHGLPTEARVFVTARLKLMITKLNEVKASGLWDGIEIYCVNSPWSRQEAIPLMELARFLELAGEAKKEPVAARKEQIRRGQKRATKATQDARVAGRALREEATKSVAEEKVEGVEPGPGGVSIDFAGVPGEEKKTGEVERNGGRGMAGTGGSADGCEPEGS